MEFPCPIFPSPTVLDLRKEELPSLGYFFRSFKSFEVIKRDFNTSEGFPPSRQMSQEVTDLLAMLRHELALMDAQIASSRQARGASPFDPTRHLAAIADDEVASLFDEYFPGVPNLFLQPASAARGQSATERPSREGPRETAPAAQTRQHPSSSASPQATPEVVPATEAPSAGSTPASTLERQPAPAETVAEPPLASSLSQSTAGASQPSTAAVAAAKSVEPLKSAEPAPVAVAAAGNEQSAPAPVVVGGYAERVTAMYRKYQPDKLANVGTVLGKYAGVEEQLIAALVRKYGPEPSREEGEAASAASPQAVAAPGPVAAAPSPVPAPQPAAVSAAPSARVPTGGQAPTAAGGGGAQTYRDRITAMYKTYQPEKLSSVEGMLEKYKGMEDQLMVALVRKYGAEPTIADAVLAEAPLARATSVATVELSPSPPREAAAQPTVTASSNLSMTARPVTAAAAAAEAPPIPAQRCGMLLNFGRPGFFQSFKPTYVVADAECVRWYKSERAFLDAPTAPLDRVGYFIESVNSRGSRFKLPAVCIPRVTTDMCKKATESNKFYFGVQYFEKEDQILLVLAADTVEDRNAWIFYLTAMIPLSIPHGCEDLANIPVGRAVPLHRKEVMSGEAPGSPNNFGSKKVT